MMPYRVTIPDTCDRFGCSGPEAAAIISKTLKIAQSSPELKLPSPFNRTVTYGDEKTGETRAVVEYYEIAPAWLEEDEDTKS
jgi:hypothetical protein